MSCFFDGIQGLAEFAPAGANKMVSVFCGDMRVAENTYRGASVEMCNTGAH